MSGYGPQDVEFPEDDYEATEPVCVCEQYVGTTQVVYCKACKMYTDDKELLMENS